MTRMMCMILHCVQNETGEAVDSSLKGQRQICSGIIWKVRFS